MFMVNDEGIIELQFLFSMKVEEIVYNWFLGLNVYDFSCRNGVDVYRFILSRVYCFDCMQDFIDCYFY